MRFCDSHWHDLKEAVRARGLGHFIAGAGDLQRRLDEGGFEPLLGAHNAIVGNALAATRLEVMLPNEDGSERCPLCYVISMCPCGQPTCPFMNWINRAADEQLVEARARGLLG